MSTFLANQAKIIANGAPRVVHNDERLEEHTNTLFRLTAVDNTSPSELEAIELLANRIVVECRLPASVSLDNLCRTLLRCSLLPAIGIALFLFTPGTAVIAETGWVVPASPAHISSRIQGSRSMTTGTPDTHVIRDDSPSNGLCNFVFWFA